MSFTPKYQGRVTEDGKLKLDNRRLFDAHVSRLKGKSVELVLRERKTRRSVNQNSYIQAAVRVIANEIGEDHDATRYALMGAKWGWRWSDTLEREVPNKPSSASMTVEEASEFIDWLPAWSLEHLGIHIPLPNEADYSGAA